MKITISQCSICGSLVGDTSAHTSTTDHRRFGMRVIDITMTKREKEWLLDLNSKKK